MKKRKFILRVDELEMLIFQIDLMLSDDKMSEGAGSLFTTKESE
jgi:hypothetical protein